MVLIDLYTYTEIRSYLLAIVSTNQKPFEIRKKISGFQMVFDKMAAICLDFKWLGIQISDPFQNPGHLKPNSDCTASLSLIPLAFIELQLSSGVDNLDFEIEGFFASGTNFLDPAEDFSDVSFWSKIRKSSSSLAMTPSFVAKFLFRSTIIERSF